jgi:membrane fusion protein (multidrug efflux system)
MEPEPTEFRRARPARARWIAGAAALAVAGLAAWWWMRGRESTDDARVDGRVHALAAMVGGTVLAVHVEENQPVAADDLLVEIDPRDYQLALAAAEADLAAASAAARGATDGLEVSSAAADSRLASARSGEAAAIARLAAANAHLVAAEAEAERSAKERERLAPLVAKSEVSKSEFDAVDTAARSAEAARDAAKAAVEEARRGLETSRADLRSAQTAPQSKSADRAKAEAAQARVAQAQAAVDKAKLDLERTRITAPVAGVVGRRGVEVGDRVAPGQAILGLVGTDRVWIVANFKESQLERMRVGQPVRIRVDAYPGEEFRGKVASIGPATQGTFSMLPAQNATGNFVKVVQRVPVRIELDAAPDASHPLRPGLSVVPTVDVR